MQSNESSTCINVANFSRSAVSFSKLAYAIQTHCMRMSMVGTIGLIGVGMSQVSMAALTIKEGDKVQQYRSSYNQYNQQYSQYNTDRVEDTYSQYKKKYNQYNNYQQKYQKKSQEYKPSSYGSRSYESSNSYNSANTYNQSYKESSSYATYGSSAGYNSSSTNYFEEARQSANRGDMSALYKYEQMMQGGLFAMYPEYWRLSSDINNLSSSTVISFVKRYPNTVMAEKLVADFAETKAGTGDYAAVQQVSRYIQNADKSEACAVAIGDVRGRSSMRVIEQKGKVWLNTLKQPALCNQLAMEMNTSSLINDTDRKNRLYRMLREGKTGQIMALAGNLGTSIGYSELQDIQFSQNNFLNRFNSQTPSQKNQYLYLYALGKMADKSYREAGMQLAFDIRQDNQRRQKLLSADTRKMAYRTLGVARMNMNTDDGFNREAVDWFRNSVGLPFNYEEAEDYAMAGIRFNEWNDVITAITAMDASHQQEPTWQYWLARAYEQTGSKRKSKALYKKVAKHDNYYGFLAKDKLKQRLSFSGTSLPNISSHQRSDMLKNPHFARAFALHSVNKNYARREWNWGVNQALKNNDKDVLLAAARHAHDLGWYDRAIYAMEKAKEKYGIMNVGLSHPMPHRHSVVRYSQRAGIDPAWAYGIMRQESRFNVGARSGVGASGLMQIMPGTGKYIARKLGESYSSRRVNSGDTNIRYGTWYMGDILNQAGGQTAVATAGYNAGPSKAERWQPNFGNLSADQYVETIAYPETRDYVKRVMENATVYGSQMGNSQKITQRMGVVYPKY